MRTSSSRPAWSTVETSHNENRKTDEVQAGRTAAVHLKCLGVFTWKFEESVCISEPNTCVLEVIRKTHRTLPLTRTQKKNPTSKCCLVKLLMVIYKDHMLFLCLGIVN